MKPIIQRTLAALAFSVAATSAMATDIGVSVSIGQPNFYGRIDLGGYPQPQLIYPRPIVIVPPPVGVLYAPLYLHVPPGHARDWKKHCRRYGACGRPVYFVQDSWYQSVYAPHYARHDDDDDDDDDDDHRRGRKHGYDKGHGKHKDD